MVVVVRLAGVDGGVVGVGEEVLLCPRLLGLTIHWSGLILPSEAGLAGWDPLWTTSFLYGTSPLYGTTKTMVNSTPQGLWLEHLS